MKSVYRLIIGLTLKPLITVILTATIRILDKIPWMPVFYFSLPHSTTNAVSVMHILHHIQVTTGRTVIVVSTWPIWPWESRNDRELTSFVKNLNRNIRYIWIPFRLQQVLNRIINLTAKMAQLQSKLYDPMGMNATFRYNEGSTFLQTNILNKGNRVVLDIPTSHTQKYERQLNELGISTNDWFVCVHARESGWVAKLGAYDLTPPANFQFSESDHRNVDIADYMLAIKYITSIGGKVVRMGDPSMKKLEAMEGVIDYPFMPQKSLPMDLYILSRCKFVIGCVTGFSNGLVLPMGKPLLLTNFPGALWSADFPYNNTSILFKHVIVNESQRRLSMRETMHPNLSSINDTPLFSDLGYTWAPNDPEDILEAAKEMNHLVDSDSFNQPLTREQEMFHNYRLEALEMVGKTIHRQRYARSTMTESRISACFSARYFGEEEHRSMSEDMEAPPFNLRVVHYGSR